MFTVASGDTPATLAPKLLEAGVIDSERAFLFEARTTDLAARLAAGRYSLAGNLTPAQVVTGLVDNRIVTTSVPVTFREGLRLEQITALLTKVNTENHTAVDPAAFYNLVTKPTDALLGDYPWLLDENVRPKGASLEGFLYPATYDLRTDGTNPTTADDLVRMMLDAWINAVGQDKLDVPAKRGLTFYQVLTLASIVEREAVLDEERPLIAGVYQNRIDRVPSVKHGLLQADPTVIYAVDTVNLGKYSPDWVNYRFWTVPQGRLAHGPAAARQPGRVQHVQGPGPAAGPDRDPQPGLARRRAQPEHEEQVHVLRGDPQRQGRARLLEEPRRARAEAPEVRLLGCRPPGSRSPRTSRHRPTPRRGPAGSRRSGVTARAGSPGSASGWSPRTSAPTSGPGASTCAGSPGSRSPRARTRSPGTRASSWSARTTSSC